MIQAAERSIINPMSAEAPVAGSHPRPAHYQMRSSIFSALLVFAIPVSSTVAQSSCPGIHVKILDIKNSTGTVACALFEAEEGFPRDYLRFATNIMVIKIRKTQARCDFEDIPPGNYAMVVVHDENMNGKLDTNWMGIPTEGYGFSKSAKALMGPPKFTAASFLYDGQNIDMTMKLNY